MTTPLRLNAPHRLSSIWRVLSQHKHLSNAAVRPKMQRIHQDRTWHGAEWHNLPPPRATYQQIKDGRLLFWRIKTQRWGFQDEQSIHLESMALMPVRDDETQDVSLPIMEHLKPQANSSEYKFIQAAPQSYKVEELCNALRSNQSNYCLHYNNFFISVICKKYPLNS